MKFSQFNLFQLFRNSVISLVLTGGFSASLSTSFSAVLSSASTGSSSPVSSPILAQYSLMISTSSSIFSIDISYMLSAVSFGLTSIKCFRVSLSALTFIPSGIAIYISAFIFFTLQTTASLLTVWASARSFIRFKCSCFCSSLITFSTGSGEPPSLLRSSTDPINWTSNAFLNRSLWSRIAWNTVSSVPPSYFDKVLLTNILNCSARNVSWLFGNIDFKESQT